MPHIRQIHEQLSELNEGLRKLNELVLQERESITGLDIAGLDAHRSEIENLFVQIRVLSDQAANQIRTACDLSGIRDDKGLTPLIAAIPESSRGELLQLQKEIHSEALELENALAINSALLKDSLAFTNQSLLLFTGMLKSSSMYGQAGRFVETSGQPRIICKEI